MGNRPQENQPNQIAHDTPSRLGDSSKTERLEVAVEGLPKGLSFGVDVGVYVEV